MLKIFTPEEANKALPLLRPLMKDIMEKHREAVLLQQKGAGRSLAGSLGRISSKHDLSRLEGEISDLARMVGNLGCIIKDLEKGLVDFPAVVDRRPAYLCWKAGEEGVEFWHGVEEGFAGRKPVRNLKERN